MLSLPVLFFFLRLPSSPMPRGKQRALLLLAGSVPVASLGLGAFAIVRWQAAQCIPENYRCPECQVPHRMILALQSKASFAASR